MPAFANKCPKCGTKVKIRSRSMDGKKARCPKCSAAFRIKAPSALKADARPKPPSEEFSFLGRITDDDLAHHGLDEEDLDAHDVMTEEEEEAAAEAANREQAEAKVKRKHAAQRRAELTFVATVIGVGMLLLLALGFAAWQFFPRLLQGEARLTWMPDDVEGFLEIKPEELWEAGALSPLREAEMGVRLKQYFDSLLNPIAWTDVRRIAVGFPPSDSPHPEPVFVLYAKSSFNAAQIKSQANGFDEASHAGQRYLAGGQPPRAAYFPQSDVLVYGTEAQIISAIDRGGVCAAASNFDLPVPHTIVFSSKNPERFGVPNLQPIAGGDLDVAADAQGFTGLTLAANVSDDFAIVGTLSYDTAETAAAFVTRIEEQLQEKRERIESQQSESPSSQPGGGGQQLVTAQQQLLKSIGISKSDSLVDVELTIPGYFVGHSFAYFSSFASDLFPNAFAVDAGDPPGETNLSN